MDSLEQKLNLIELAGLDDIQKEELIKTYIIYIELKKNINQGGFFQKERYDAYKISYLIGKIKKGKTSLEIMNKIIDECDKYSKKKIIKIASQKKNFLNDARN